MNIEEKLQLLGQQTKLNQLKNELSIPNMTRVCICAGVYPIENTNKDEIWLVVGPNSEQFAKIEVSRPHKYSPGHQYIVNIEPLVISEQYA